MTRRDLYRTLAAAHMVGVKVEHPQLGYALLRSAQARREPATAQAPYRPEHARHQGARERARRLRQLERQARAGAPEVAA